MVAQAYADSARALAEIDQPLNTEVLAFRHNFDQFATQLKRFGFCPVGVHGSSGPAVAEHDWVEKLKAPIFTRLFLPTAELVRSPHLPNNGYLLLHETELNNPAAKAAVLTHPPDTLLVLENVVYPGSLSKTVDKIQELQELEINTGLMLDLLHLAKELGTVEQGMDKKAFSAIWNQVIAQADRVLSRVKVAGLHIPVGPNGDSLPLAVMGADQWRMLAGVISHHRNTIRFLTLENQQKGLQLRLAQSAIPELNRRNGRIVSSLIETGVLR